MATVLLFTVFLLITDSFTIVSQKKIGLKSTKELITVKNDSTSMPTFGSIFLNDRGFRSTASLSDMEAKSAYDLANIIINNSIETGVNLNKILNKNSTKTQTNISANVTWLSDKPNIILSKIKRFSNQGEPTEDLWINSELEKKNRFVQMHAFVVRDENIPECGVVAEKITKTRYFMCTGVILSRNRILTSASCITSAEIHEHHVKGDLAVLIGALTDRSQVIKIDYYEVHPKYIFNPQLDDYEKYNIAMITLSCPIPSRLLIIPKLPTQYYEDIGHMCCRNKCKLLTVVQNLKNYHMIREMEVKHIPSVIHDRTKSIYKVKPFPINLQIKNWKQNDLPPIISLSLRKSREPEIAPTPEFFTQEMANKIKLNRLKNSKKEDFVVSLRDADFSTDEEKNETKSETENENHEHEITTKDPENESPSSTNEGETTPADGTQTEDASFKKEMDWNSIGQEILSNSISDANREKLTNFIINSMGDLMTKLVDAMTKHLADSENIYELLKLFLNESSPVDSDKFNENISENLGKHMLKFAVNELLLSNKLDSLSSNVGDENMAQNNSDTNSTNNNNSTITDESNDNSTQLNDTDSLGVGNETKTPMQNINIEKNVNCPPLGSPIIVNNILIALIAYTCDDLQNWVEWKYVGISSNIEWITSELKKPIPSEKIIKKIYRQLTQVT